MVQQDVYFAELRPQISPLIAHFFQRHWCGSLEKWSKGLQVKLAVCFLPDEPVMFLKCLIWFLCTRLWQTMGVYITACNLKISSDSVIACTNQSLMVSFPNSIYQTTLPFCTVCSLQQHRLNWLNKWITSAQCNRDQLSRKVLHIINLLQILSDLCWCAGWEVVVNCVSAIFSQHCS